MPSTGKSVCVTCREVNKHCEHEQIYCGKKWAAPRKTNDKAWKCIESGDIWWDKRRIDRKFRTRPSADKVSNYRKIFHNWPYASMTKTIEKIRSHNTRSTRRFATKRKNKNV